MARQRPDVRDRMLELEPDPIGQPVAAGGAEAAGDPHRPETDAARPDQRADRDQRPQAGISSEIKASDSPKASANTIGGAQVNRFIMENLQMLHDHARK